MSDLGHFFFVGSMAVLTSVASMLVLFVIVWALATLADIEAKLDRLLKRGDNNG